MSTKHTPGPWTIHEDPDNSGYFTIYPDSGHPIGENGAYFGKPDAILIAAAPELLEALEDWMRVVDVKDCSLYCEETQLRIKKAVAAIAKAKGES